MTASTNHTGHNQFYKNYGTMKARRPKKVSRQGMHCKFLRNQDFAKHDMKCTPEGKDERMEEKKVMERSQRIDEIAQEMHIFLALAFCTADDLSSASSPAATPCSSSSASPAVATSPSSASTSFSSSLAPALASVSTSACTPSASPTPATSSSAPTPSTLSSSRCSMLLLTLREFVDHHKPMTYDDEMVTAALDYVDARHDIEESELSFIDYMLQVLLTDSG